MALNGLILVIVMGWASPGVAETKGEPPSPPATVRLDEIVVTGEKVRAFMERYPKEAVSIDDKEIRKRNILDAYEALSAFPGVDIRQSPGSTSARISIRGSGGSGPVLVMIDGRPVNTNPNGGVDLSGIPVDTIRNLVVFKPPVPVWLGPGSSAGVIYIETKKAGMEKKKTDKGRLTLTGGSSGFFGINGTNGIGTKTGGVLLAAGYSHLDGKRENCYRDSGNASVNWDCKTDSGTQFQVNGKYYHIFHGVAGPTYNLTPNAEQVYDKGSLDTKIKGFISETSDYDLKLYSDILSLKDRANDGNVYAMDLRTTGFSGELSLSGETDRHSLRLGGLAEQMRVDQSLAGKHERDTLSLHAEHTYKEDRLTMTIGVRGDYTNDYDANPGGRFGGIFALQPGTALKTNIGYSVNLPSFGQDRKSVV
jgi:iron complex outermembrane receptor protein